MSYLNTHDPYAPDPKLTPVNQTPVSITLTKAEWITVRSALGMLASREESFSSTNKNVLLKKKSRDQAVYIRGIDNKIKSKI
jgi:hypothetical protein